MEAALSERLNEDIAGRLEEVALLLATQGASRFRVRAYQRAAETVRRLPRPVSDILAQEGLEGLQALPGVGESIFTYSDDGRGERQYTVITAGGGPLQGRRIVRGRETECLDDARTTRNARSSQVRSTA